MGLTPSIRGRGRSFHYNVLLIGTDKMTIESIYSRGKLMRKLLRCHVKPPSSAAMIAWP